MPRLRLLAALVFPATIAAALTLSPIRTLVKPSDPAPDGAAFVTVDRPVAGPHGQIVAHGTTGALVRVTPANLDVVVRSGDPLPAPLIGRFGDFSNPAIGNDGTIAFVATTTSPDAPTALFADRSGTGTLTLIDVRRRAPSVNGHGDIAYRDGNVGVMLWGHLTGTSTRVARRGDPAPGGGQLGRLRVQPALNDDGQVAFVSDFTNQDVGGVFAWTAAGGLREVARTGRPSSAPGLVYGRFSTAPVAMNAPGDVAFVAPLGAPGSAEGAFVWSPKSGATRTIAATGDFLVGQRLSGIGPYIGIDAARRVAFAGTFGEQLRVLLAEVGSQPRALTGDIAPATGFFPLLTDSGRAVWVRNGGLEQYDLTRGTVVGSTDRTPIEATFVARGPSVNETGTAVFAADREALDSIVPGGTTTLASTGDAIPGAGQILRFGGHVVRGNRIAFYVTQRDGRRALVARNGTALAKVAVMGEESPVGGTFDLADDILDVEGRTVVFASGLNGGVTGGVFRAKVGQPGLRVLLQQGNPAPGGGVFQRVERVVAAGDETLVVSQLDPAGTQRGLYAVRRNGRRIVRIAGTGDPAPGIPGAALLGIGPVVVSGPRTLFVAGMSGASQTVGLFLRKGRRITPIPTVETAGAATAPFALAGTVALDGKTIAVAGIRPDANGTMGIFFRKKGAFEHVVIEGELNPFGAPIDMGEPALALAGSTVVFQPGLDPTVPEPLFARDVSAR